MKPSARQQQWWNW